MNFVKNVAILFEFDTFECEFRKPIFDSLSGFEPIVLPVLESSVA